jgi:hypothetical protein
MAYFIFEVNLTHGPDTTDKGMNLLAVVYFLANTIVALIASFSIAFAREQVRHAERTRRASIYLELYNRFHEPGVTFSNRKILSLSAGYKKNKHAQESLSAYAHRILLDLAEQHEQARENLNPDDTDYTKMTAVLWFFEYIGVLVQRNYLRAEDVFDLMGGVIIEIEDILKDHIKWMRKKDPHKWANMLSLMKSARTTKRRGQWHSFDEGYYRISGHHAPSRLA